MQNRNEKVKMCPLRPGYICECDSSRSGSASQPGAYNLRMTSEEAMKKINLQLDLATASSRNRLYRAPGASSFSPTSVDTQGSYTLTYARPC